MGIRFRASHFGQSGGKTNLVRLSKSKQASYGAKRTRRWYPGHLFVCSWDSSAVQLGFLDIENSSQHRLLLLCLAPRRVRFARRWTQTSKPALTDSSLAAKRRVDALHVVFFFIRAHHDDDLLLLLLLLWCTLVCMVRSHKRRALGALLFLVARSSPASTDATYNSLAAERRGDCIRASSLYL